MNDLPEPSGERALKSVYSDAEALSHPDRERSWSLEMVHPFEEIYRDPLMSKRDSGRFVRDLPSGERAEIRGSSVIAKMKGSDQEVVVCYDVADHIRRRHFRSTNGGRFNTGVTLSGLLEKLADQMPAQIDVAFGVAKIELSWRNPIGKRASVSVSDMRERGVLPDADYELLEGVLPRVVRENREGDGATRFRLAQIVNRSRRSTDWELRVLHDVVVPVFLVPKKDTCHATAVIEQDLRGRLKLATMYPGPPLERMPNDPVFSSHIELSGSRNSVSVDQLIKRAGKGKPLTTQEQAFLAYFEDAQRFWLLEHGFVASRPPKVRQR